METKKMGFGARVKEFFRKLIVGLKRKPQTIPMLVLAAAFIVYSFNLSDISDTTAKIQGNMMGLCGFATMLFSMLSFVCFLNAFPQRKKANIPMLVLMFLMIALVIGCDLIYQSRIMTAITRADNPIVIDGGTQYIADAYNMLYDHIIILIVAVVLIATLPLYSKLIRKIKTSVAVEDNGKMDAIDISGEN